MNTCGNCHYFDLLHGQGKDTGHCLAEPPMAFPAMVPNPGALLKPGSPAMQPVVQSVERPVMATRRACRHWERKRNG